MSCSYGFPAFCKQLFNLYTDSHYSFKALQTIKTVPCIKTGNDQIKMLFQQIQNVTHQRKLPYFVGHRRAHSGLLGPLTDSTPEPADKLTKMIALHQVELAQYSSAFHNQNSRSLRKQLGLTRETAHHIVKQYDVCPQYFPVSYLGENP